MEALTEESGSSRIIAPKKGFILSKDQQQSINQNRCGKQTSFNWLHGINDPPAFRETSYVEVRFKNGRKEFFSYPPEMTIEDGDIVAIEASPGHDIGIISLSGDLVRLQMERKHADLERKPLKRVFRHARLSDIEKWLEAVSLEEMTMYKTRVIALDLGLDMKINDVEYQGDKTKAIFYYTASDRVDFRELIRKLADSFHVRIEMRQIGVRQESAKVGGIGSCGRELCCSSWMNGFHSVSTNSARLQQLSLNPQKLAGQCGKLKCCLNYEVNAYIDALNNFPDNGIKLKTKKGDAYHQKTDVFKEVMWYAYADDSNNMMAIPIEKVKEIIAMNSKNKLPVELEEYALEKEQKNNFEANLEQDLSNFV